MKLSVWSEKNQKNVSDSLTDYNLTWEFSNTSSDDEIENKKNTNM